MAKLDQRGFYLQFSTASGGSFIFRNARKTKKWNLYFNGIVPRLEVAEYSLKVRLKVMHNTMINQTCRWPNLW